MYDLVKCQLKDPCKLHTYNFNSKREKVPQRTSVKMALS